MQAFRVCVAFVLLLGLGQSVGASDWVSKRYFTFPLSGCIWINTHGEPWGTAPTRPLQFHPLPCSFNMHPNLGPVSGSGDHTEWSTSVLLAGTAHWIVEANANHIAGSGPGIYPGLSANASVAGYRDVRIIDWVGEGQKPQAMAQGEVRVAISFSNEGERCDFYPPSGGPGGTGALVFRNIQLTGKTLGVSGTTSPPSPPSPPRLVASPFPSWTPPHSGSTDLQGSLISGIPTGGQGQLGASLGLSIPWGVSLSFPIVWPTGLCSISDSSSNLCAQAGASCPPDLSEAATQTLTMTNWGGSCLQDPCPAFSLDVVMGLQSAGSTWAGNALSFSIRSEMAVDLALFAPDDPQ